MREDFPISEFNIRVGTAQGKQGIWFLLFPDMENTGYFAITQGIFFRHGKYFDCTINKKHASFFKFQKCLAMLLTALLIPLHYYKKLHPIDMYLGMYMYNHNVI